MDPKLLRLLQTIGYLNFATDPADEPGGGDKAAGSAGDEGNDPESDDDKDEKLGEPGKKALVAERDARKQAEKDLAEARARLKDLEDAGKTDDQKLRDEHETLKAELAKVTKERDDLVSEKTVAELRTTVLGEKEVPKEGHALVRGATREELEASADAVLELLKSTHRMPAPRDRSGGTQASVAAGREMFAHERKN